MTSGRGPIGLSYEETSLASFGQWEFERQAETQEEFTAQPDVTESADGVLAAGLETVAALFVFEKQIECAFSSY